ncbi:MAG: hypothetical protein LBI28_12230 [Treponema sp.]|jgi:hypothetical protein|nr:hypothetical protein [Treponema sp.]
MKKTGIFVISMIIFGLLFIGCATTNKSEAENHYYYEMFVISIANYNSVVAPSITYEAILAYKNSLKNYSEEYIGSGSDETRKGIYDFFIERGLTPKEANDFISKINSVGNYLFTVGSEEYYVVLYIEKL